MSVMDKIGKVRVAKSEEMSATDKPAPFCFLILPLTAKIFEINLTFD